MHQYLYQFRVYSPTSLQIDSLTQHFFTHPTILTILEDALQKCMNEPTAQHSQLMSEYSTLQPD